jgi:hypothetical protein
MFGLFDYTVYGFNDLSGAIAHPDSAIGSYPFIGKGIGEVAVIMSQEQTLHDIGTNGVVVVSRALVHNGMLRIQCQQTSDMHKWLLYAYMIITMNVDQPKYWAQMAATLRNISDGTGHTVSGISFQKIPDKVYATQGQMVTWNLMAAEIDSTAPNPSGNGFLNNLKKLIS